MLQAPLFTTLLAGNTLKYVCNTAKSKIPLHCIIYKNTDVSDWTDCTHPKKNKNPLTLLCHCTVDRSTLMDVFYSRHGGRQRRIGKQKWQSRGRNTDKKRHFGFFRGVLQELITDHFSYSIHSTYKMSWIKTEILNMALWITDLRQRKSGSCLGC